MDDGVGSRDGGGGDGAAAPASHDPAAEEAQRRRRRRHHRHHHHRHHHHQHSAPAPASPVPAPVDDIEDMVRTPASLRMRGRLLIHPSDTPTRNKQHQQLPLDEWGQAGLLEGGRLGPALTPVGFSSQPNRPVGVVIPRFIGRKRPRGGAATAAVRGRSGSGSGDEEEGQEGGGSVKGETGVKGVSTADPASVDGAGGGGGGLLPPVPPPPQRQDHQDRMAAPPLPGAQRIWCVDLCCGSCMHACIM